MDKLVNVGSIVGKEVLDLENGIFVGKAQNILVYPAEQKVSGLLLRQKGLLNNKNVIELENIKAFGSHTITLEKMSSMSVPDGVNILDMPVVTIDGTVLGRVVDFAFDPVSGTLKEYVLAGRDADSHLVSKGVLRSEWVTTIGREVIIAREKIALDDLYAVEEDVYQNWQEIDEILAQVMRDQDDELEETIEEFTEKINDTIDDVEEKLQNISGDELLPKLKEQAEKFTGDVKNLLGGLKAKMPVSKIDLSDLREEWKSKFAAKNANANLSEEDGEAILMQQIEEQLQGSTVQRPVMDAAGNVIIWPGQMIDQDKIKAAVASGKLQDIIDLIIPLEENTTSKKMADSDKIDEENADE